MRPKRVVPLGRFTADIHPPDSSWWAEADRQTLALRPAPQPGRSRSRDDRVRRPIRRVTHRGQISEWRYNPLWVRLDIEAHEEFGIERLTLVSRGRLDLSRSVSDIVSLEGVRVGIEKLERQEGNPIRILVKP